jgi:RHS repeat-associated protein
VTDALGHRRSAVGNGVGLPVSLTNPVGSTTTVEHDAFGRVTSVTDALGRVTRLGWTVEGRLAWRKTGDGTAERFEWDAAGNLVTYSDQAGNTSSYTPTHFHLASVRTRPDGSRYTFTYDTELNLVQVTNPQGATWEYVYDEANRVVGETDFNGRTLTYEVNAMGELVALTNGAGETVSFGRDALGRTTSVRHDGQTTVLRYDGAGHLVEQAGPEVRVERAHDAAARLIAESVNGRTNVPLRRPRPSHRTAYSLRHRFDLVVRRGRTPGRPGGGRPSDELPLRPRRTGNGPLSASRGDARPVVGRRQQAHASEPVPAPRGSRDPPPAPHVRLPGRWPPHRTRRVHDRHPQLRPRYRGTSHCRPRTELDGDGNLSATSTPATGADDVHREFTGTLIRRCGRTRYERDGEGRIVRSVRRLLNGQKRVRTYTWNSQSQLVRTVTPDGARWRYVYDPAGRRVAKQRLAADGSVAEETRFTWDGPRLAEQVTSTGHGTTWDYAPGNHLPLTQIDHASGSRADAPAVDARFHAVITDLSGAPECRTPLPTETAAGAGDGARAGAVDCPLRFPGQYADSETGWHYNHHRYYDPETGHYATPDPLGLGPAPNDTAYVPNPYRWIDPLGLYRNLKNGEYAKDPDAPETAHNRKVEYPSGYRESTHDEMAKSWTLEGVQQGERPLDSNGKKIPRDQLTWFDSNGDVIWGPTNPGSKPFHETVTYEHREAVVDHWNREGRLTDHATQRLLQRPGQHGGHGEEKELARRGNDGGPIQPGKRPELLLHLMPAPDVEHRDEPGRNHGSAVHHQGFP